MAREFDGNPGAIAANRVDDAVELRPQQRLAPLLGRNHRTVIDEIVNRAPDERPPAVTEELEVGTVDIDVATLLVEQHHRIPRAPERLPEQGRPSRSLPVQDGRRPEIIGCVDERHGKRSSDGRTYLHGGFRG